MRLDLRERPHGGRERVPPPTGRRLVGGGLFLYTAAVTASTRWTKSVQPSASESYRRLINRTTARPTAASRDAARGPAT
ncbi:hypothetical protein GCM10014715_55590 [Streptomyces spiralis]|uniref:Uncharacterized protein n=1 Tax=Streptomyces spiralis TaxID=66376 RepID=A0A919A9C1_9ACTN|nr:hypothetical protein GCM10014715_55590 [Streptomyces spiralis]